MAAMTAVAMMASSRLSQKLCIPTFRLRIPTAYPPAPKKAACPKLGMPA